MCLGLFVIITMEWGNLKHILLPSQIYIYMEKDNIYIYIYVYKFGMEKKYMWNFTT